MNLIEQLGGYEAAKAEGEKWGFDDFLNNQLLDYRREHGIFENGDKVVRIYYSENSMLFTVMDITSKGYSFGNDWGWRGVISNMGVGHTFRHATDSEIQAGKRLD